MKNKLLLIVAFFSLSSAWADPEVAEIIAASTHFAKLLKTQNGLSNFKVYKAAKELGADSTIGSEYLRSWFTVNVEGNIGQTFEVERATFRSNDPASIIYRFYRAETRANNFIVIPDFALKTFKIGPEPADLAANVGMTREDESIELIRSDAKCIIQKIDHGRCFRIHYFDATTGKAVWEAYRLPYATPETTAFFQKALLDVYSDIRAK